MIEAILNADNGITPNLKTCMINYQLFEEKRVWEVEFNHWYRALRGYSESVAEDYKREFQELKDRLKFKQLEK